MDLAPAPEFAPGLPAPYAPPQDAALGPLREALMRLPPEREAAVDALATRLIEAVRTGSGLGGVEELLRQYALDTREGLALMVLAESLLRVPDAETADRLIEDRLGSADFAHPRTGGTWLGDASAWALGLSVRVIRPGETPEGVLAALGRRIGLPALRTATRQAVKLLGGHFVLGQTIGEALGRAASPAGRAFRHSFDMLGEGARTAEDARRYERSYAEAIEAIGRAAGNQPLPARPGISVKLSALHPRFVATARPRVLRELVPVLNRLMRAARAHELNFTVDAEEQDRLELSLEVMERALEDPSLAGWDGFGLAVQAYGKRAMAVLDWAEALAERLDRRLMVRLVKGAYWDTEVKRAQERGLDGYPVWTRKPATDLAYMACAARMLGMRPRVFAQFATHNALTVAAILQRAGDAEGFEFQRLHGMGDALYAKLRKLRPEVAVRTYAPVGGHADLLAYLVRRLLENGANSSFVSLAADPAVPVERLLQRPEAALASDGGPTLPLPRDLYGDRPNSRGVEFGHAATLRRLAEGVRREEGPWHAAPLVDGQLLPGAMRELRDPATGRVIGTVTESAEAASRAMAAAHGFAPRWDRTPADERAATLERAADLLEAERDAFLALLAREGGKTLEDGVAEIREAADFLRFYANGARRLFRPEALPGPTGESNVLIRHGRGAWLCISPWNFPLAIFLGQVAAALAAGNAVVAKPAEQTPLVAARAVALLHRAGIPAGALHLVPGDGAVGAALVEHRHVAGVAFTGGTDTAWRINRALAAKDGPIVPLIAETGGINAMFVDATALPEQVADDVCASAFRSAGQRCSALRLLCVQEDVADRMLAMIAGAARELALGHPADPQTEIGPVIDAEARERLLAHIARMRGEAKVVLDGTAPEGGHFVAPHIFGIARPEHLREEVFGPILHVVRWRRDALRETLAGVAASGFALTLGVQSRNESFAREVLDAVPAGNSYVNRSMIGAVVGTQPFGGMGLSGTGPKAGGPDYLRRFALERVETVNTAAAGGNVALLAGRG
ncbi:bifunctional proline dehydrogenase/L-glutamate gamma-semialdehyde dehydrogenase PutA [Sabulicella glaciei]|uniref:Bifunctional protein PutA n=1 Tax=Sabulicella glaciei TaxID=2984948 RepID=A0ABT3NX76_9PROT|nr:bifunctional proline dehydrogenase/L-glutamate gamma-semialdehyde dehydrogenase PutA [Roseococcus sp. MDT2-1-1]MCW8086778.1 bifunctional proline dehydrogenase/L-glutamate gamma-semialdehyde dehydrogenase PutA [Roseococcus sp. MDT2-1-1]